MSRMDNFLFVHIPKTAGTSFRKSAESYFGSNNTFFDYGQGVKDTSCLIQEYTYDQNDRFGLFKKLDSRPRNFLSGHFPLNKYLPIYNLQNVICFVREPAQQIRSHFEHFVRSHGYKKSFVDFIHEPRFINFQSKYLRGAALQSIGFIGLTERYDDSVKMINREYGFSIPVSHMNRNNSKKNEFYEFSNEELDLIKNLNTEDFDLYSKAKQLFERRVECSKTEKPFIRGELTLNALPKLQIGHYIHGWLMDLNSDEPTNGYVTINNGDRVEVAAKDYRPWLKERFGHRMGFVGFHKKLPQELKEGDQLSLYDENDLLIDSYCFEGE